MQTTNYEAVQRKAKVAEIVAVVEQLAVEQKFELGPVAISLALSSPTFDWQAVAYRVTAARAAKGDTRFCHLPSYETRAAVIAHFEQFTASEQAQKASAERIWARIAAAYDEPSQRGFGRCAVCTKPMSEHTAETSKECAQ